MHVYIIPAPRNQFAINPRFPRKRKVMHLHFLGYGTMNDLGPVHTSAFSFENAYISMRFGLPSTLIRSNTLSVFTENASI